MLIKVEATEKARWKDEFASLSEKRNEAVTFTECTERENIEADDGVWAELTIPDDDAEIERGDVVEVSQKCSGWWDILSLR